MRYGTTKMQHHTHTSKPNMTSLKLLIKGINFLGIIYHVRYQINTDKNQQTLSTQKIGLLKQAQHCIHLSDTVYLWLTYND